jgi:hypothetical protein
MKKALTSVFMVTFAVALSFVLVTGSQVQAQRGPSNEDRTIFEILRDQDGAQGFLALVEYAAEERCPAISRRLDRRRASLVALVPHNVAIEEFLGVTQRTFEDLDIEEIVGLLPEILERKGLDVRDVCRLLRRHISKAEAQTVQELLERGFITMLNGDEFPVAIGRGGVTVARFAPITVYDVFTQNGVIQYLDRVVPPEDTPSENAVTVFVTSVPHDGNFVGLEGADQFCQGLADDAGLPGTWTAWLSDDNNDAVDRIPNGEYRLVNGTLVANNKNDLTGGTLRASINLNEAGGAGATSTVWTSTKPDGTSIDGVAPNNDKSNCSNWVSNAPETGGCTNGDENCAALGNVNEIDGDWTLQGGTASPFVSQCSAYQSIYCFGR